MSTKSKTLLIIGGTGFFGKSILDYFVHCSSLKNIKKITFFNIYNNYYLKLVYLLLKIKFYIRHF